jgi:hypothetical protein
MSPAIYKTVNYTSTWLIHSYQGNKKPSIQHEISMTWIKAPIEKRKSDDE